MSRTVIDIESRRPGWRHGRCICGMCGHRWVGVLAPGARWYGLQCPACLTRSGVCWEFAAYDPCRGFEVEPGVWSGCRFGDGTATAAMYATDECPACGRTGMVEPTPPARREP